MSGIKKQRSTFPVASMKKLALEVTNKDLFAKKASYKDEIIANYDALEGKVVLAEMASIGFDPKRMKVLSGLAKRLRNYKKLLESETLTEETVKRICKELSINYQETYGSEPSLKVVSTSLLMRILTSTSENEREIAECNAKKNAYLKLEKQYVAGRKPVLKDWRVLYRKLVVQERKRITENPELIQLKLVRSTHTGKEGKAIRDDARVKIGELEDELQNELAKRLVDPQIISSSLGVDLQSAQRYAFIFSRRQAIDEISSRCVRIARLGEVLSMLAEKLTQSMVVHITEKLRTQSMFELKVKQADLVGFDKATNPTIVLALCSPTKTQIDAGLEFEVSEQAKSLYTSVSNVASVTLKSVRWANGTKEALCAIVYDSLVSFTEMFKETVSGNAKTISKAGVEQVIHQHLSSHGVDRTLLDAELARIFAKPVKA